MPGLGPGIHAFSGFAIIRRRGWQWKSSLVDFHTNFVPQAAYTATCGDKPGHDDAGKS
jgi:hypothetical protein